MSKETDKLSTFIEEHTGSVKLDGFFYCESLTDYRCTVVAKVETRKARLIEGAEFSGRTPAELVAAAADAGVDARGSPPPPRGSRIFFALYDAGIRVSSGSLPRHRLVRDRRSSCHGARGVAAREGTEARGRRARARTLIFALCDSRARMPPSCMADGLEGIFEAEICECGWELPFAVMPMRNVEDPGEDSIIAGAIVTLSCPRCGHGHCFYTTRSAVDAPLAVRTKLGIG